MFLLYLSEGCLHESPQIRNIIIPFVELEGKKTRPCKHFGRNEGLRNSTVGLCHFSFAVMNHTFFVVVFNMCLLNKNQLIYGVTSKKQSHHLKQSHQRIVTALNFFFWHPLETLWYVLTNDVLIPSAL